VTFGAAKIRWIEVAVECGTIIRHNSARVCHSCARVTPGSGVFIFPGS